MATGAVWLAVVAALVASCTTAGTPVAEQSSPAPAASSPPGATAVPPPPPPVASDEDQIRQTVQAFQDAYNTENWDAYRELMCPSMRERFTGVVMDAVKKTRANQGISRAAVTAVTVDGDTATATIEGQNESLGTNTITMPMERSDGWKVCMHY